MSKRIRAALDSPWEASRRDSGARVFEMWYPVTSWDFLRGSVDPLGRSRRLFKRSLDRDINFGPWSRALDLSNVTQQSSRESSVNEILIHSRCLSARLDPLGRFCKRRSMYTHITCRASNVGLVPLCLPLPLILF